MRIKTKDNVAQPLVSIIVDDINYDGNRQFGSKPFYLFEPADMCENEYVFTLEEFVPSVITITNPTDDVIDFSDVAIEIRDLTFTRDNNIVTQRFSKLMYQDDESAVSFEGTHDEAMLQCQMLPLGGHDDWRLPTSGEIFAYEWAQKIGGVFVNIAPNDGYWSSTFTPDGPVAHKGSGVGFGVPQSPTSDHKVRCVRTIEDIRSCPSQ